jgi:two-component system response regulator NreC
MKAVFPNFIFIENCFCGHCTDAFIKRMVQQYKGLNIVVWAACEVKAPVAARFIFAGAESFFSLRDTESNIETIIYRIAGGRHYYPADVEAAIDSDNGNPVIGEGLTERELQITKNAVKGKSNQEVGDILSLSIHTVKFHKNNIYRKCGGKTPVDILRNGLLRGLLRIEDLEE